MLQSFNCCLSELTFFFSLERNCHLFSKYFFGIDQYLHHFASCNYFKLTALNA